MSTTKSINVTEAIKRYLKSEENRNLSYHYTRTLKHHLTEFAKLYGTRQIMSITLEDANRFLAKIPVPRTRVNYVGSLKNFGRWAQDSDYIPYDRRTFADCIKRPRIVVNEPEFFSAEEMRRLFRSASKMPEKYEWLLSLLIFGGFVGIRTSEICRLKWTDILLEHHSVRLSQTITKTQRRRIADIPPNAVEWIEAIKHRAGPLIPQNLIPNLNRYTALLIKDSGVNWKGNGLRHSYVTYAMAKERNAWQVSEQVGNSPSILQVHYKGLVLPSEAEEWFNITPNNTL